jgi:hypothetical protein
MSSQVTHHDYCVFPSSNSSSKINKKQKVGDGSGLLNAPPFIQAG